MPGCGFICGVDFLQSSTTESKCYGTLCYSLSFDTSRIYFLDVPWFHTNDLQLQCKSECWKDSYIVPCVDRSLFGRDAREETKWRVLFWQQICTKEVTGDTVNSYLPCNVLIQLGVLINLTKWGWIQWCSFLIGQNSMWGLCAGRLTLWTGVIWCYPTQHYNQSTIMMYPS